MVQDQTDVVNANEKLRQQAYIDALTGLRNRPAFLEDFSYGGVPRETDYALFMCRIDHLSSIYEAYSNQVGDTYLRSFSKLLRNEMGDDTAVYRLGGDVFMITTQWSGETQSLEFAETLQELVGGFTINVDGHTVRQSITIGIAKLPAKQDFNTALNLCQRALDAALSLIHI